MTHKLVSFRQTRYLDDIFDEINVSIVPKDRYSEVELLEYTTNADALFVHSENTYSRRVIENADSLQVIGKAGSGIDNIDVDAATDNGVLVVHTPGMNGCAVSEHTVGMLLSFFRRFPRADEHIRSGGWRSEDWWGTELRGKTVGLVGLGSAGYETAKRLQPFEVDLLATDPYIDDARAEMVDATLVKLDDLLARSDVVSLHVRLTDETHKMIGSSEFDRMKSDAILLNTARGDVIDEEALIASLRENNIGGAGIDVFSEEPPGPDHPLFEFDNVLVTPHLAGATRETRLRMLHHTAENVIKVLNNETVEKQCIANPDARW